MSTTAGLSIKAVAWGNTPIQQIGYQTTLVNLQHFEKNPLLYLSGKGIHLKKW